jgi:hypothetical protein
MSDQPETESEKKFSGCQGKGQPPIPAEPMSKMGRALELDGGRAGIGANGEPCCPICGGPLMEIRAKKHCQRCHAICETCCEGGPM